MADASTSHMTESNEVLKLKFKKLHSKVVDSVNPANVINILFQEDVIGAVDMKALLKLRDDPQQQCSELLALLHTSGNRQAFIHLYLAIKTETYLQWLVEDIDDFAVPLQTMHQPCIREATVGEVVHTLPEGEIVWGITSLGDEIYVLRPKGLDDIEVYDAITYRLLRCLTVPNSHGFADMTICEHYRLLYIVDPIVTRVHRLDLHGQATRWAVNDKPYGISVNAAHNVLVTCPAIRKIKEFSSFGNLLRELTVQSDIVNPWHAVQLTNGQFIVCHGEADDPIHRVCKMSTEGRDLIHSHGGRPGSDTGHYNVPRHLAVDTNEFVFVADVNNRRVTLLSPEFDYAHPVVSRDKLKWRPRRLHLDVRRRRLYVADNEFKDGTLSVGRVVVFSV